MCFVALLVAGRLGATTDVLTVYDLAGLRMGVAALLAVPFLLRAYPWGVGVRPHIVVAFFGGAPFVLLIFAGMIFAPVGHAAVMMNGALPVFAVLVTWIWIGDRPGRWQWVGISAIVVGVPLSVGMRSPAVIRDNGVVIFCFSGRQCLRQCSGTRACVRGG